MSTHIAMDLNADGSLKWRVGGESSSFSLLPQHGHSHIGTHRKRDTGAERRTGSQEFCVS